MFKDINVNRNLTHYGFPEIQQLPSVIYSVNRRATYIGDDETGEPIYNEELPKPIIKYSGTTKLHGTNAGIVIDFLNEIIYFESREVIICPSDGKIPSNDVFGFATYMSTIQEDIVNLVKSIIDINSIDWNDNIFVLYGEWVGGSIQKNVALSKLEKMFVAFKGTIRTRKNTESRNLIWFSKEQLNLYKIPSKKFYNIYDFKTWEIEIDFNSHHDTVPIINQLTKEVENECPVGKYFGVEGIGEGCVWSSMTEGYESCDFWFKSKGDKHAKNKVKIERPVDNEKVAKLMEIADLVTPSWRLEQMYTEVFNGNPTKTKLGDYIKSVIADVEKEEKIVLKEAGVVLRDISSYVSNITRDYYLMMEKDFLENK